MGKMMKIIGHAFGGDLIIQVSQAEWDGLQDGVRPKDGWENTQIREFFSTYRFPGISHSVRSEIFSLYESGEINGSLKSLVSFFEKRSVRSLGRRGKETLKRAMMNELEGQ